MGEAVGGILVDEVHDIFSEVGHVFGKGETQMPKRVSLLPDELVADLLAQPDIVFGGCQVVVLTDE